MTTTHTRFVVALPAHARDPQAWILHAGETIVMVMAYFTTDENGMAVQLPDGNYEVHAPMWSTLDALREILTAHEGFTIILEEEVPGNGLLVSGSNGSDWSEGFDPTLDDDEH